MVSPIFITRSLIFTPRASISQIQFLGRAGQYRERAVVHRNHHTRIDQPHRVGRAYWPHREMVANTHKHDVDLVVIRHQGHVGKESGITRVVDRWAAANGDD